MFKPPSTRINPALARQDYFKENPIDQTLARSEQELPQRGSKQPHQQFAFRKVGPRGNPSQQQMRLSTHQQPKTIKPQQQTQQQPKPSPQATPQPKPTPQQQQPEQPTQEQQATEEAVPIPEPINGAHDIMLSYNWDHQETAFKVRDYFRSKGNLSVWIDVEQMSGDMNTKMAQAIMKSKMVIMCLSEKYQNSANCKKEYEYTDKKSKKFIPLKVQDEYTPEDGTSLDLILGSQLYYCIEKEEDFDKNMPKVLNIILDFLKRKH